MDTIARVKRELAYNAWANREVLHSVLAAPTVPERARAVVAHLVGAEWLWLRRLGYPAVEMAVWPALSAECDGQLRELSRAWQAFAGGLTLVGLAREVAYTNTKGESWVSTVADILTQVVLHASYHRGQIATLLGQAGTAAAYSDYIECVRRGYLDAGWPA